MTVADYTYILRVGGVVDSSGDQIAYTTRPLAYTSPPTQSVALRDVSGTVQQALRILEPIGSAVGATVSLVYGAAYVDRLTRQRIVPVRTSAGQIVRMTRPALTASILWLSGEPDLSGGDLFFVGGECMSYTSWTAAGSWTVGAGYAAVSRGIGGTYATAIGVSGAGTVLLSELPTIVGQPYTLSRVAADATSSSSETVVMRGYVDDVDPSGALVSISLGSALSRVRDRQYVPPAPTTMDDGVTLAWDVTDVGISPATSGYGLADIGGDALPQDTTGTPLLWLDLSRDGTSAWLLAAGEWADTYVDGVHTLRVAISSSSKALLMRVGGRVLSSSEAASMLARPWSVSSVQLADQIATSAVDLGTAINRLLTDTSPVGMRCMLPAAFVAADLGSTLKEATGVESVATSCYDGTERLVMPPTPKPRPMREVLGDMLAPWGVSLASTGSGRVCVVDWLEPREAYGDLTATSSARSEWSSLRMRQQAAIRAVTIDAVGEYGQEVRRTMVSDIASQISQGGEHITVDSGLWGPLWTAIQARWYGLLSQYQLAAPVAQVTCSVDTSVDVGSWVSLTSPTMHSPDGTRGVTAAAAIVTGRSERLDYPDVSLALALVGWAAAPNARRWAPALRVASVTTTAGEDKITAADYFDADEASHFTAGDHVILYDAVGNVVDGTAREVTAVGAGFVTCTSFSTAPTADDIVVLADYDETPSRTWAWMADTAGTLGAAADDGHTWR